MHVFIYLSNSWREIVFAVLYETIIYQRFKNLALNSFFPGPTKNESKHIDLNTLANSGYMSRINDKSLKSSTDGYLASVSRTPNTNPVLENSCAPKYDTKVLDYADALIQARDLAQSAGIRCSSTPLASSVMKGVKVLARLDRDGLYYLGQVREQVSKV